jgi:hypothetical protein
MLFIILQNGLYLDNLHFSNIDVKKTYISWNKGLKLSVDKILITKSTKKHVSAFTIEDISKPINLFSKYQALVHTVTIKNLSTSGLNAAFSYNSDTNSSLQIDYRDNTAKLDIYLVDNILKLDLKECHDKNSSYQINGYIFLDTLKNKSYAKLNAVVNNDLNITAFGIMDTQKIRYRAVGHKPVKEIKQILSTIAFDKHLKYWVHDAIDTKDVHIEELHGSVDLQNIKDFYKKLYVRAVADKLIYKYNPNLEPVVSQETLLEFTQGILFIKPVGTHSYHTSLKDSWLKIDFTKRHEWLDLYLILDGKLNKDILSILQAYKIKLPIRQTKGKVSTDLHLGIDLQTIDTDVEGDFSTDDAVFDFMGVPLHTSNTKVFLKNTKITTNSMKINYKDILETNATLIYDAKENTGSIDLLVSDINVSNVTLSKGNKPLHALYTIDNNNSKLSINASEWNFLNQTIFLDPLTFAFNVHNLAINIPPTLFNVNDVAKGYVGGLVDLNTTKADLDIDLIKFNFGGVALDQSDAPFKVHYGKELNIQSINDIYLLVNGSPYKVKNAKVVIDDENVKLKHTLLEVGNFITTKIYAKYNYKTNKAHLSLNNFLLKNPKTGNTLYQNNKILLHAYVKQNHIEIKSTELDASFYSDAYLWKLNIHSLGRVAKGSQLLKDLQLTSGDASFYKKSDEEETQFKANIIYPYTLVLLNDKAVKQYEITGRIKKDLRIYFDINKKIKVKISDKTKINCKKIGINLNEIIHFVNDINSATTNTKDANASVFLNATDSYIYLDDQRRAISDKIYLQYTDKILTAQLRYKKGYAGFMLKKNNFHLYGTNFNDTFMQNVFSLAKFKGGNLDFSMEGKLSDYNGVFYIQNTTLMDYKLLNNVLAFVNTIPSLVTFSLPNYDKDGLEVQSAYINFHYKDSLFNITDIYLNSKEISILGKGNADIAQNNIDLTMNLKTDLASNVSKIPLVGYIVFDGKSLSTTLKVNGDLNDPTINTQVAQDIVVAPLNIIKRTLILPYNLIKKAVTDINTSK